jgi:hypothetical protein
MLMMHTAGFVHVRLERCAPSGPVTGPTYFVAPTSGVGISSGRNGHVPTSHSSIIYSFARVRIVYDDNIAFAEPCAAGGQTRVKREDTADSGKLNSTSQGRKPPPRRTQHLTPPDTHQRRFWTLQRTAWSPRCLSVPILVCGHCHATRTRR